MQLDYRQFLLKLEAMSDLKPLPYQDYVSNYVKAYYIPESDLEAWVKQHNNVTFNNDYYDDDEKFRSRAKAWTKCAFL